MIYRIDVRTAGGVGGGDAAIDPVGAALRHQIAEFESDVGAIQTSRIFLIDSEADTADISRAALGLLADPVTERAELVAPGQQDDDGHSRIEIHLKPGVMDPVASSTEMALRDMGLPVREVRTGRAYRIQGRVDRGVLARIAGRVLANGVIESVHFDAYVPEQFRRGRDNPLQVRHVPLRDLGDEQLARLSREGHLFLSPAEMKAVQSYYREQGRDPTDAELETIAQTWSEHCVHKTLKSAVDVDEVDAAGKTVGRRHYDNLIKETIFASTQELMRRGAGIHPVSEAAQHGQPARATGFCLSVFKDNAGVIAFDDVDAVCIKVETHNHPSAIEPYGGSATGVGGVIRDILGTGLAARPVANTDVFCVASPGYDRDRLPRGIIHPKRVLQQVVAGVRDYGNRMGIPTVNGAVYFDDRYLGNPLVFCGCVGILPRNCIEKAARDGDAIVVMGGRTGRDGIHGATFSSAELTDTHADEFSHAVQIGNAITEKKMADVLLQARDRGLFTAVTDCGAGGLSSAVGEMGEEIGASVELDKVPLKYAGLRYDEIWISEAQERMVMSVPQDKLAELLELSAAEDVESTVIGRFGTPNRELLLNFNRQEVGRLSMDFLHHGIPMPRRKAVVMQRNAPQRDAGVSPVRGAASVEVIASSGSNRHGRDAGVPDRVRDRLLALLAHPNIASKHWVIRQYDHEVQGGSVIKPLVGPRQVGPSDAAVIRPKLGSYRGVALAVGMAPQIPDPYDMALASIDEAVRNAVAVGADLSRLAILDNFCWPSVDDEKSMGALVAACEACRDAALAYGVPFISGKDSLHNQFTNSETGEVIRIPNTLLISAIGVLDDVRRCITMDLKRAGNALYRIQPSGNRLENFAAAHRVVAAMINTGNIVACHDVSDGGWLVAAAEMCIASGLGLLLEPDDRAFFDEPRGQYLVELEADEQELAAWSRKEPAIKFDRLGSVQHSPEMVLHLDEQAMQITVELLTRAWRGTLDW